MVAENYILGLDVGTKKVAALLGRLRQGQLTVCAVGLAASEGLRRGEVVDLAKTSACISQALANLQANMNGESAASLLKSEISNLKSPLPSLPRRAWVGVSGEHIRSFNPRADIAILRPGRPISPRDVEEVMRKAIGSVSLPPGHEVIHVVARNFALPAGEEPGHRAADPANAKPRANPPSGAVVFDSNLARPLAAAASRGKPAIANPVGMCANTLEVQAHVIAASAGALGHLEHCVEQAGLGVEGFVLEPLASADAVLSEAERDLGVVLLDLGAGTTDVTIFADGAICYSGCLPLGGSHITRDLAVCLEIDVEEAENLKIAQGRVQLEIDGHEPMVSIKPLSAEEPREIPCSLLAEIIQPRAVEILSLTKDLMVRSGFFHRITAGAVLTGGASQLEGLLPLARHILGLPVRMGRPFGFAQDKPFGFVYPEQGRGAQGRSSGNGQGKRAVSPAEMPARLSDPAFSTGLGLLFYGSNEQVYAPPPAWSHSRPSFLGLLRGWWKNLFGP